MEVDRIRDDVMLYKMDSPQRGKLLIFNNQNFKNFSKREGSDVDAAKISKSFKDLNFKVKIHKDQSYQQMKTIVNDESQADHTNEDCFAICILTHGNNNVIYGADEVEITLEVLINDLKTCKTLAGKPKMLFIESSLGDKKDEGIVQADGGESKTEKKIPIEADFLYSHSTVQGYQSLRTSSKDSWYIDALSRMLKQHGNQLEIVEILTRVNQDVSKKFEKETGCKQIPCFTSMLTKQVRF